MLYMDTVVLYATSYMYYSGPLYSWTPPPFCNSSIPSLDWPNEINMNCVISWWRHQMEKFPRYWPFVRGSHWPLVNSPDRGQWRGALMFSLIHAWINDWVNDREAGDLRRHGAHYNVSIMCVPSCKHHHYGEYHVSSQPQYHIFVIPPHLVLLPIGKDRPVGQRGSQGGCIPSLD